MGKTMNAEQEMKAARERAWQAAIVRFLRALVGWAMYTGFIYCLVKWPLRAVALGCFMVAVNIHSVGLKLGK